MPEIKVDGITLRYEIGDCLELMKDIPDNSIDLVLTDPPYNVKLDYGYIEDDLPDAEYGQWCHLWIRELHRIMKEGHYCIIFTGDLKSYWVFNAIVQTDLQFHHFLKWYKPNCQRGLSGTVLFNRTELAFVCSKAKPNIKLINRKELYQDTLTYPNTTPTSKGAVNHNARRPIPLYSQIIKGFTKEYDWVLDNFLGTGTTLISCRETKRNGIGFEINPDCEPIIRKRIMADIDPIESSVKRTLKDFGER